MDLSNIFRDLAIVLAIATGVALIFGKLRLSVIPAFLIAGMILGPTGAGLVAERRMVAGVAEIGVALYLFTIGMEFSLSRIGKMPRHFVGAGAAQVGITIVATLVAALPAGLPVPEALFVGFVVSLSSTAIVLKVYTDRGALDTSPGRVSLSILLFQDVAAIPMMLLIPSLREWDAGHVAEIFLPLLKSGVAVVGLFLFARILIPRLLREIVRLNTRDVLALTVLLVCIGTAYLARKLGLPLGMGAFLAGMVIAESDYVHEIAAQMAPFRDVLFGISYISVGMLVDIDFFWRHVPLILATLSGVVLLKLLTGGVAIRILGYSWRVTAMAAIGLVQIGEFSFLLLSEARGVDLIGYASYEVLMAITVLTMTATPLLMGLAPAAGGALARRIALRGGADEEGDEAPPREAGLENHVIITGYGMNGKNLARVLKATRIPYVVADLSDAKVRQGRVDGEPMFFGDVNSPEILERLRVDKARMLVLAISDPMATRRAVAVARRVNPSLFILVRTRYVADVDDLIALGANAVIPEEFETSVEIFAQVLAEYHVPGHIIRQQEAIVRSGTYRILRERVAPGNGEVLSEFEEFLRRKVIEIFYIARGSGWEGRTVGDLPLDGARGLVLLSILREERALIQPRDNERLAAGDKLVLFGGHAPLAAALGALANPPPRSEDPA